jgi:hypothetical protein
MVHLPRRHFFNLRNEKHYRKRENTMGGINLDGVHSEYIRGQVTPQHAVQEAIDGLNAATIALDKLIREMQSNCECKE